MPGIVADRRAGLSGGFWDESGIGDRVTSQTGGFWRYVGPLLSSLVEELRGLIAGSATFRTWTGTDNLYDAKARCHIASVANPTRPFAYVALGDEWQAEAIGGGDANTYLHTAELLLMFEAAVTEDGSSYAAENEFSEDVDAIINEICVDAGSSGNLTIRDVRLEYGPVRASEAEQYAGDDFYQAFYIVEVGV